MSKPELPPLPGRAIGQDWQDETVIAYGLACYKAGMLRAAEICERAEEDAHARYKGKLPNQERGTAYNPHDEGRSDGASECETAIRAEADKH